MAELKELLKKAIKQDRLIGSGLLTQIMDEVSALDYQHLVDEAPGVISGLGNVLEGRVGEIEAVGNEKATAFVLNYLPQITDKLVSSDTEIKSELVATEDMNFNVKAGDIAEVHVEIKDGAISFSPGLIEDRDFYMDMTTTKVLRLMAGKDDALSGFMGGSIAMWRDDDVGDMSKAFSLLPLITVVAGGLQLDTTM